MAPGTVFLCRRTIAVWRQPISGSTHLLPTDFYQCSPSMYQHPIVARFTDCGTDPVLKASQAVSL
jgi:hypothetical protein